VSETHWHGKPAIARRCLVVVDRRVRHAVEVTVGRKKPMYFDNSEGRAWTKATEASGSPSIEVDQLQPIDVSYDLDAGDELGDKARRRRKR
jgi:hypothetical protein